MSGISTLTKARVSYMTFLSRSMAMITSLLQLYKYPLLELLIILYLMACFILGLLLATSSMGSTLIYPVDPQGQMLDGSLYQGLTGPTAINTRPSQGKPAP